MKNYFLILLFVLPLFGFSQDNLDKTPKQHINMLKEGKLLVRLHDKSNSIKILLEKGMVKRAEYVKKKQDILNLEIMKSFTNFKFCDVHFFYSNDSKFIKEGNYNKVKLYSFDSEGLKTNGINLDANFLVADFGEMSGKNKMGMKAMYIMDNKLNQLSRPFPFYVRFHPTPIQNLSHAKVVKRMDKKLKKFYNQNN